MLLAQLTFLDRLPLVAGNPLTYVAFIFLVLAWFGRFYFGRTWTYLQSLADLPDTDKLAFAQMVVLGFPKTLTEKQLKAIQGRYKLIAYVATLLTVVIVVGMVGYFSKAIAEGFEEAQGLREEGWDLETNQLTSGMARTAEQPNELAAREPKRREHVGRLNDVIQGFSDYEDVLTEHEQLLLTLTNAALANAELRFDDTLEFLREADAQRFVEDAPEIYGLRGDAYRGLGQWREAITQYESLDQDDFGTQVRLLASYWNGGELGLAVELFNTLVPPLRQLVQDEERARPADRYRFAWVLTARAVAFVELGKPDRALQDADEAITILTDLGDVDELTETDVVLAWSLGVRAGARLDLGGSDRVLEDAERAIVILTELVEDQGRDDLANALARSHDTRGRGYDKFRRPGDALDDYDKAIKLFESDGRREQARIDLAGSYSNRGNTYQRLRRLDEALADYGRAIDIWAPLVENEGRDELARKLAKIYNNRAGAYVDLGRLNEALREYGKAIAIFTRLFTDESTDAALHTRANDLAMSYGSRGFAKRMLGRLSESLDDYNMAVEARSYLVEEEGRVELRNALAFSLRGRGKTYVELDRLDEALTDHDNAIAILVDLIENEGRAEELDNELALSLSFRGNTYNKRGRLDEALADHDEAINILKRLVNVDGHSELRSDLAIRLTDRANTLADLDRLDEALADYDQAIVILERLVEDEGRAEELANDLAESILGRARVLVSNNKPDDARSDLVRAKELLGSSTTPKTPHNQRLLDEVDSLAQLIDDGS